MSVYVAGAWKHRKLLQCYMNDLQSKHKIVVNSHWVSRENGINTPEDLTQCGKFDFDEIAVSDILLVIMDDPEYAYRGTFAEIGYAYGKGKKIIIVCNGISNRISDTRYEYSHYCMGNVFFWLPGIIHVESLDEAIEVIHAHDVSTV